jgi:hypothetical protein
MQGAGLWDRWVMRHLPYALRNPLHTGFSMMGMLAVFLLMFALSARLLRTGQAAFFVFTLALFIPGLLTSLYLSPLIPITAALLGGRMLATGRLPWRLALGILVVVNLLHLGKQEMRESYWEMLGGTERNVQPFEYPAFFSEWADAGLARLAEGEARGGVEQATPAAVLDRMSLMHMLLLAQDTAPAKVGFLEGETFRTIPGSLVPRMIWAGKPPSHAGQVAMNIHFGVQRADQTENTFIAWGTVSEGWANFGYVGVLLFGVAFGALLGGVQRFTIGAPMTSLRFVIGVVFLTLGISVTQTAAGVWISMVWQSLMVVIGGSLLFMKRRPFVPVEPEPETGGDAAPALPPAPSRA